MKSDEAKLPATRKIRVLAIDDDKAVRDVLEERLRHSGYDVLFAKDARTGARLLVQEKPDLVLLDVHLPCRSAIEFLTVARGERSTKIPIIYVSGRADISVRDLAP